MTRDTITLGSDPWSERVVTALRDSPHQATLRAWADGKDPRESDTPYMEYLTTQKRAPRAKAERMQAAFHALSQADGWHDTIEFGIRADGSIASLDGWHRLNILLHRGAPLTGRVTERHPRWVALKGTLTRRLGAWKGALYHPIPHPDFDGWPVHHPSPPPLGDVMVEHRLRTVLDLGTHFGFALYSLRHHALDGVGIERDPLAHRVASLVLGRVRMTAVRADLVEYLRRAPPVDLALALNILHHVPLDVTLARLRARFVAVSLPTPDEAGSARLPPDPYEYVRAALRATVAWEGPFEGRRLQLLRVGS